MKKNEVNPCHGCPNCLGRPSGFGVNSTIPCLVGAFIDYVYLTRALLCKNNPSLSTQDQSSSEPLAIPPGTS